MRLVSALLAPTGLAAPAPNISGRRSNPYRIGQSWHKQRSINNPVCTARARRYALILAVRTPVISILRGNREDKLRSPPLPHASTNSAWRRPPRRASACVTYRNGVDDEDEAFDRMHGAAAP